MRSRTARAAALLQEPLVHFLLIGLAIFASYAAITPSVSKDRLIAVTPAVRQSVIDIFKKERNAEPSAAEVEDLVDLWILNEVTYREALALGLDRGDDMIRERLMQKMRLLIFGNVTVDNPKPEDLKTWFEARRAQYDTPEILSFFEVPFVGPNAEADARAALKQIEAESETEELRSKARAFDLRPRPSLEVAFGKDFTDALANAAKGQWQVLKSNEGWHIVRLDAHDPGQRAEMQDIETQLVNQWRDERRRTLATSAVRDLAQSYVIRREDK